MEVKNVGGKIQIEGSYYEIALITTALDKYLHNVDSQILEELVNKLHNPEVVVIK